MHKVVLLRHGQSEWNLANRFTGWVDVDLTPQGVEEAKQGARLLKAAGFRFDVAYTSLLKRSIRTLWIALDELDQMWIPVHRDWRLNERHYGALQGLNKAETAAKHGDAQVLAWRRSYATPPPPLDEDDPLSPGHDPRYGDLKRSEIPRVESLQDVMGRFVPYWKSTIARSIIAGDNVLICAHGNSLRALVKHLDDVSEEEIVGLNIPTGLPLVYELDDALQPVRHYYLGDPEEAARRARAVADQAKGP